MTTGSDWAGRVGQVWAEQWLRTERSFAELGPVLEQRILAVAPESGRFLDIGCGVGTTALAVADGRPAAQVTGIDLAADMVALARRRVPADATIRFIAGDVLGNGPLAGPFDLLFSRHGMMFFTDPVAAFARLWVAAAPGAPLVFSCFAAIARNPWATLLASAPSPATGYRPGPFALADEAATRALLLDAGWRDPVMMPVRYGYVAGDGCDPVAEAVALFSRIGPAAVTLREADPQARPTLLDRLARAVEPFREGNRIVLPALATIWSAQA